MASRELDETDAAILDLLGENARRTLADVSWHVNLSASAVRRRIERLEETRVITGYTVTVDHAKVGRPVHAFTEVRFSAAGDLTGFQAATAGSPEVEAVYATAGDLDALVRLRAADIDRLGRVVEGLRQSGWVAGTKTLVVLKTWTRRSSAHVC